MRVGCHPRSAARDVATHIVSYDELSEAATITTFLRGGLRTGTVNDVALACYKDLDTDGIMDLVARNQRPRGLPSGFKGGIALTDGTIHHEDIRRALGLPRRIPEHRLAGRSSALEDLTGRWAADFLRKRTERS